MQTDNAFLSACAVAFAGTVAVLLWQAATAPKPAFWIVNTIFPAEADHNIIADDSPLQSGTWWRLRPDGGEL